MNTVNGKIRRWSVQPFRWNRKLASYKLSPSEGMFAIRVKNIVKGKPRPDQKAFYSFHYSDFGNPETMQDWVHNTLTRTGFFPTPASEELSKIIPPQLLRNFKFEVDRNHGGPRRPVTLVLLDVKMERRPGCSRSGPGKKEKIPAGNPAEEVELFQPEEDEVIDDYLSETLEDDLSLVPVVEELGTEHQGLYRVKRDLTIKISDGHGLADDEECTICFDRVCDGESEVATTPCLHNFHLDCLAEWLPKNGACPICRAYCTTIV